MSVTRKPEDNMTAEAKFQQAKDQLKNGFQFHHLQSNLADLKGGFQKNSMWVNRHEQMIWRVKKKYR